CRSPCRPKRRSRLRRSAAGIRSGLAAHNPPSRGFLPPDRIALLMSLDDLRQQIDAVDEELVALLNRRADIVVEIGRIKNAGGTPIYSPDREKAVLDKIRAANKGPLPDKTLVAIYRELMSGSFMLERPLRITYLGPQGSYSHLAAVSKFGSSVEYEPV